MEQSGGRSIVNISSVAGLRGSRGDRRRHQLGPALKPKASFAAAARTFPRRSTDARAQLRHPSAEASRPERSPQCCERSFSTPKKMAAPPPRRGGASPEKSATEASHGEHQRDRPLSTPPYRISIHCSWRFGPTSLRFCLIVPSQPRPRLLNVARSDASWPFEVRRGTPSSRMARPARSPSLSLETIDERRASLAALGPALAKDGEVLLWSCETGRGARGAAFLAALAQASGASVAAASGRVGAAAPGGGWALDGAALRAPLTALGIAAYTGVMVAINWLGPKGSKGKPTSGTWNTTTNWDAGKVPGRSDDANLGGNMPIP